MPRQIKSCQLCNATILSSDACVFHPNLTYLCLVCFARKVLANFKLLDPHKDVDD